MKAVGFHVRAYSSEVEHGMGAAEGRAAEKGKSQLEENAKHKPGNWEEHDDFLRKGR